MNDDTLLANAPTPANPLLPPREAAKALSISERSLFTLSKRGDVRTVRIGRAVRYHLADLQRFVEQAKERRPQPGNGGGR